MDTQKPIPLLDDQDRIQEIDKRRMLRMVDELPEQCETALAIGRSLNLKASKEEPNAILIFGVGDSAIAVDLAATLLAEETTRPVMSTHSPFVPGYIGQESVVFVVDYSGKSPAALRFYTQAKERNAYVICLASGGKLLEMAEEDGAQIIKVPPGQPPRTALGFLLIPIVAAIQKMGYVSNLLEKLSNAILLMKNERELLRVTNPTSKNRAKIIAEALFNKVVVVFGETDYRKSVANRLKSQLNSNSKVLACLNLFSDIIETEISGFEQTDKLCKDIAFIFLRDSKDEKETVDLIQAAKSVLKENNTVDLELVGANTAEKVLFGVYISDYISCYLAFLYEMNPSQTENVNLIQDYLLKDSEEQE